VQGAPVSPLSLSLSSLAPAVCSLHSCGSSLLLILSLFLRFSPPVPFREKREIDGHSSPLGRAGFRAHGPTNFPPSATAARSSSLLVSEEGSVPAERAARGAHRRFEVATVLAGKLFDRLPLNHSSRTPALLSRVLPPPLPAMMLGPSVFLSPPLSPPSASPRRWPLARASPFQGSSGWTDALLSLEKSL